MKARTVFYILGIFISLLLLAAVAGLGVYAYQSNDQRRAAQEQLLSLQKSYDQLKTEHTALKTEYDQTKGKLEVAHGQIASLEGELKTAKDQNQKLEQTIQVARLNMNVLAGLFDTTITMQDMETRIAATGDSEMSQRWNTATDETGMSNFIVYLIHSISASLN